MNDDSPTFEYHPISLADLDAMDIPDPEFIIENILVDGAAVTINGREKSGKGFHLVDMASCIAAEEPYCGQAVRKPGAVLYMSCEESPRTLRKRFRTRLGGKMGAPIDILPLDGFTDERFQLDNGQHLQALTDLIRARNYVLVILDTLREAHSARENDSDEMAPLVRRIRDIAHGLGVTFLVSHHQNKGLGQSRGSTAILASFDDEIAFTRSESVSDVTIRGKLRAEGRNLPKFVMSVAMDSETGRWMLSDEPEVVEDSTLRGRILQVIDDSLKGATANEIADKLVGVTLKSVQNKLSEMRKETPKPFAESGNPTRNNPRRYLPLQPRMDMEHPDNVTPFEAAGGDWHDFGHGRAAS